MTTPDDKTIKFALKDAHPEMPFLVALPTTPPVPKAKDTGAKYEAEFVASGPYMRDGTYDQTTKLTLKKNPNWDPKSAKFYTTERMTKAGITDSALIERESANAGRRMLISVLERLTGTHIDSYAEVNLFGFYLLSDAIGGVPVCLNNAVDDPFSGAKFPAGPQEVQGTAALSFVRQRQGLPNGDLDRVRRQQAFLSGAISKVLSVGTLTDPTKLSALVDAANRSIVLSSGFNLLELAQQMSSLSSGDVEFMTLPTHGPEPSTTKDALAVDVQEVQTLFAQLAEPSDTSPPATASGTAAGLPGAEAAITGAPALHGDLGAFVGAADSTTAPDPTSDPATINAGTATCVN